MRQRHGQPGPRRGEPPGLACRVVANVPGSTRRRESPRRNGSSAATSAPCSARRFHAAVGRYPIPGPNDHSIPAGLSTNSARARMILTCSSSACRGVGNEFDEFEPFDAIIVAMGKEIPRDQEFQTLPEASRRQHRDQHDDAAEQHRQLQHQPPIAAEPAQQHRDDGHGQQKAAARQQGGGMQHDLAGDMDVDPPLAVARHRQRQQRRHERRGDRAARAPGPDRPGRG